MERSYVWIMPMAQGRASITFENPEALTKEDLDTLEEWLALVMRNMRGVLEKPKLEST